jgi:hypothetical protein
VVVGLIAAACVAAMAASAVGFWFYWVYSRQKAVKAKEMGWGGEEMELAVTDKDCDVSEIVIDCATVVDGDTK